MTRGGPQAALEGLGKEMLPTPRGARPGRDRERLMGARGLGGVSLLAMFLGVWEGAKRKTDGRTSRSTNGDTQLDLLEKGFSFVALTLGFRF